MTCIPGLIAGADLSASTNQYRFVKLSTSVDQTVVLCAATTDKPIGILQNTPNTGMAATVACSGVSKVQGDADLTVGGSVGTSADGQAATYTVTDTTKYIVGQVILGNSAAAGLATIAFDCTALRVLA
jgi:hypothetical protein